MVIERGSGVNKAQGLDTLAPHRALIWEATLYSLYVDCNVQRTRFVLQVTDLSRHFSFFRSRISQENEDIVCYLRGNVHGVEGVYDVRCNQLKGAINIPTTRGCWTTRSFKEAINILTTVLVEQAATCKPFCRHVAWKCLKVRGNGFPDRLSLFVIIAVVINYPFI